MFKGVAATGKLLVRLSPALVFLACGGDDPQVPTALAPVSTGILTGTVGAALTTIPTVTLKDQNGRGISNVWVKWTPNAGTVINDSSKTDANGTATSGGWALGTVAGSQTLSAQASQLPVATFTAVARAGLTQALQLLTPASTAVVGSDVLVLPSVRAVDQFGNVVSGASVQFAVTSGAGTITGAQQITNANGVATVGSWKLGSIAGTQALRADVVATGASVFMTATALSAPPTQLVMVDGNAQTGQANKRLCTSPVIGVRDDFGNAVPLVSVVFTPGAGSGTVTNGSVQTKPSTGNASVGAWNLSNSATQTLVVTSPALPGKQLTFTANVGPDATFGICARFIGDGGTARQREAVSKAVARWQRVIVGHVQTTHLTAPENQCAGGVPSIDEDVEDLLLFVQITGIDGPRGILGQAAPCYVHLPANLTLMGFLQLDIADLELMLGEGTLDNVVVHEIGHILGIGTLWNYRRSLLSGAGSTDPFFMGAEARNQFALIPNTYSGTPIPVENTGGAGTRDAHWRKSLFNTELMQGFSNPNMPMSRVTVGSLADLGYVVNMNGADAFSFSQALRISGSTVERQLVGDVADFPLWGVEQNGRHQVLRVPTNPLLRRP